MEITLSWQTIITTAGVVGAAVALITYFAKIVRWVDKQKKQDQDITELKTHHKSDIEAIKAEQTLLVYGVLACLKGLKEQGCNGAVTQTIAMIEKHINEKAHE